MEDNFSKRGYLNEDFKLFHIRDRKALELEYHYHEFDKIVVFISGQVTYMMEGTAYFLKPWDVLLVAHDQVHRPIIDVSEPYERIVLWMNTDYLLQHSGADYSLLRCFELARERRFSLLRLSAEQRVEVMRLLTDTEQAMRDEEFGSQLMAGTSFLQFMVLVNRLFGSCDASSIRGAYRSDPKLNEILAYINGNLCADLSIETLASRFYMSPSYLMHRFKELTGYSTHSYIQQKRLLQAAELIRGGTPVLEAGSQSGFSDYSAFLRAFKKMFKCTPSAI